MKHFTKQKSSLCSLHWKIGSTILFTHQKRKINKKTSAIKHSPSSIVYNMEFYHNFLINYSLISIVKHKFTRRNEIWCRILEKEVMSKNVRKTQGWTSLIKVIILYKNTKYILVITFRYQSMNLQKAKIIPISNFFSIYFI